MYEHPHTNFRPAEPGWRRCSIVMAPTGWSDDGPFAIAMEDDVALWSDCNGRLVPWRMDFPAADVIGRADVGKHFWCLRAPGEPLPTVDEVRAEAERRVGGPLGGLRVLWDLSTYTDEELLQIRDGALAHFEATAVRRSESE